MTRCESISPLDITTHADLSLYSSALITGLRFTASSDTIVCKTGRDFSLRIPRTWIIAVEAVAFILKSLRKTLTANSSKILTSNDTP